MIHKLVHILLTSSLLISCVSQEQKAQECLQTIALINQESPDVTASVMTTPSAANQSASQLEQLAQKLTQLKGKDSGLAQVRNKTASVYRELAEALRNQAAAADALNSNPLDVKKQAAAQAVNAKTLEVLAKNDEVTRQLKNQCGL